MAASQAVFSTAPGLLALAQVDQVAALPPNGVLPSREDVGQNQPEILNVVGQSELLGLQAPVWRSLPASVVSVFILR